MPVDRVACQHPQHARAIEREVTDHVPGEAGVVHGGPRMAIEVRDTSWCSRPYIIARARRDHCEGHRPDASDALERVADDRDDLLRRRRVDDAVQSEREVGGPGVWTQARDSTVFCDAHDRSVGGAQVERVLAMRLWDFDDRAHRLGRHGARYSSAVRFLGWYAVRWGRCVLAVGRRGLGGRVTTADEGRERRDAKEPANRHGSAGRAGGRSARKRGCVRRLAKSESSCARSIQRAPSSPARVSSSSCVRDLSTCPVSAYPHARL